MNLIFFPRKRAFENSIPIREAIIDYLLHSPETCHKASTALPDETHFEYDLGMDSIGIVELILHLERKFQIDFDQAEDIPRLDTLGALAQFTFQLAKGEDL